MNNFLQDLREKRQLGDGPKIGQDTGVEARFFLSRGCTTACLKLKGTTPEDRLLLMMARTHCPIIGKTSLKRWGETVSKGDPDGLRWPTKSSKNDRDTGSNLPKDAEQETGSEGSAAGAEMKAPAVATLSIK